MKCPNCQINRNHKIIRTYRHRSATRVYRIRQCATCKHRWRTFEQNDPRGLDTKQGGSSPRWRTKPAPVADDAPTVDAPDLTRDECSPDFERRTGMTTSTAPADPRDEPTKRTSHEPPTQTREQQQRMKDFAKKVKKEVDKLTS